MEDGETVVLIQMRLSRGEAHLNAVVLVGREICVSTLDDVFLGSHAGSVYSLL